MAFGDTEIASTGSVGGRRSQNVLAIVVAVVVVVGRRHGGYKMCCASHNRSRKNAVDPTPNDRCVCCCSTVIRTASFVVQCTRVQCINRERVIQIFITLPQCRWRDQLRRCQSCYEGKESQLSRFIYTSTTLDILYISMMSLTVLKGAFGGSWNGTEISFLTTTFGSL